LFELAVGSFYPDCPNVEPREDTMIFLFLGQMALLKNLVNLPGVHCIEKKKRTRFRFINYNQQGAWS
jgi:hypothetical protein